MSETTPAAPAGWYPAGVESQERYWDGTAWTDEVRPTAAATMTLPAPNDEPSPQKPTRKIPLWVWILAGALGLVVVILVIAGTALALGSAVGSVAGAKPATSEAAVADAETVAVPNVIGMTISEGRATLESAGLTLAAPAGAADDEVIDWQSVRAGADVESGREVEVTVEEDVAGTLESPHPAGYALTIYQGDPDNTLATLTVAIKDPNAGAAIAAANQFNDPAQPGYHYVAVEYTFTGASKTEPANVTSLLWDWSLAQTDGTLIGESNTTVVYPDGWNNAYDVNDLYEGQTGSAVVVYQVPDSYTGPLLATAYGQYVAL
ncbi:DUF2510 domain-containing protein [Microbacterium trichothecenolyticum]|uniref:PASTA domain protein n=1 Tax=Microbacterium trichothecenolyticum TaxID=69370 RepID=A0A0M2HJK7_MICTR|nr:DUF2510 domain-containing protein [Microbacterium trichothecenolyticum]KJL45018.1 PASTA domain protein [Microbacterium trichothecenolyticum]